MENNQILDFKKWFKEGGDVGFSPVRNRKVIENSIKNHEKNIAIRKKMYRSELFDRANAVDSYLKYCKSGGGKSLEKYFGRHELARLRGEDIKNQLRF